MVKMTLTKWSWLDAAATVVSWSVTSFPKDLALAMKSSEFIKSLIACILSYNLKHASSKYHFFYKKKVMLNVAVHKRFSCSQEGSEFSILFNTWLTHK